MSQSEKQVGKWQKADERPLQWIRLLQDGSFEIERPAVGQTLSRGQEDIISKQVLAKDEATGAVWWVEKPAGSYLVITSSLGKHVQQFRFRFNAEASIWQASSLTVQDSPATQAADTAEQALPSSSVMSAVRNGAEYLYKWLGADEWAKLGEFRRGRSIEFGMAEEYSLTNEAIGATVLYNEGSIVIDSIAYGDGQGIDYKHPNQGAWYFRKPGRFQKLYVQSLHNGEISNVRVLTYENGSWWEWGRRGESKNTGDVRLSGARLGRWIGLLLVVWLLLYIFSFAPSRLTE